MKSNTEVSLIKNAIIWGNHSSTQYPDISHCLINGTPAKEVIKNEEYLQKEFIEKVSKRGAEILAIKKTSSVFSAANAVKDHLRDWYHGTNEGVINSMGVISNGEYYGIPKGICFSFPVRYTGNFNYNVVKDLSICSFSQEKINKTLKELEEEKNDAFN